MIDYRLYIPIDPNIKFGKPCILGSRISVYDVLIWYANGKSSKDIIEAYPELTLEQIQACLAYADDKEHKVRVAS